MNRAVFRRRVREPAQRLGGDDPAARLLACFDVLDVCFNDPEIRECMFVNTAGEFSDRRHPIHRVAAERKLEMREHFRRLAGAADSQEPDAFADQFAMLIEGTLNLRHVYGRDDAARVIGPAAKELIDRHITRSAMPPVNANRNRHASRRE